MSDGADIDRFVKDPSLLIELCREVIEQLDTSSEATVVAEQEAQLRAIAKAVEQLEKSGVAVPDSLRAEKIRLATSLAVLANANQALEQLADEFQDILKELRERLGQGGASPNSKPRGKRSKLPKTSSQVLREHILHILRKQGGRAKVAEILDGIGRRLDGKFLPGDLVLRQDGKTLAWRNNACWERMKMRNDGTLRTDSPSGIWELSKDD